MHMHTQTKPMMEGRKDGRQAGQPPALTTHIFIPVRPERDSSLLNGMSSIPRIHIVETNHTKVVL